MRKRKTNTGMEMHLERCESSGLTISAYCKKHKIAVATYYYWRKRLPDPAVPNRSSFKEIKLAPGSRDTFIRVQFNNGTEIHIDGNVSAAYLRELAGC